MVDAGAVPPPETKMVGADISSKEDAIEGAALIECTDAAATSDASYSNDGSMGSCDSPPSVISNPLLGEGSLTNAGVAS
jgi:hypothetical protein